jgi:hypothetical protein
MRILATTLRTTTLAGALVLLSGCGGGHALTPGHDKAAAACRGTGSQAALAATQAAAVNPGYATLAADENAVAASEAPQQAALSDGDPTDDAGAGALTSSVDLGSTQRQKVIADCYNLGLPVTGG